MLISFCVCCSCIAFEVVKRSRVKLAAFFCARLQGFRVVLTTLSSTGNTEKQLKTARTLRFSSPSVEKPRFRLAGHQIAFLTKRV